NCEHNNSGSPRLAARAGGWSCAFDWLGAASSQGGRHIDDQACIRPRMARRNAPYLVEDRGYLLFGRFAFPGDGAPNGLVAIPRLRIGSSGIVGYAAEQTTIAGHLHMEIALPPGLQVRIEGSDHVEQDGLHVGCKCPPGPLLKPAMYDYGHSHPRAFAQ